MHLYFFKESLKQDIFIINILQKEPNCDWQFPKMLCIVTCNYNENIYSLDFSPAFIFYITQDGIDNASSAYFPHNKS